MQDRDRLGAGVQLSSAEPLHEDLGFGNMNQNKTNPPGRLDGIEVPAAASIPARRIGFGH
jgi:hypothetical protein